MKLIHIVTQDGRYFPTEVEDTLTDEEIVETLQEQCCIPLKGIYANLSNCGPIQPLWEAK